MSIARVRSKSNPKPKVGRPAMPKEYGLKGPRSGSGLLPWQRAAKQLAQARNYWVGTVKADGRPHVMPVWGVWLDEALWFSTSRCSQKARNLDLNPNLVIHLESGDDVVILEGVAAEITDVDQLALFAVAYDVKYQFRPDIHDLKNVTYAVRPRIAFGWLEADFPGGATRWQF